MEPGDMGTQVEFYFDVVCPYAYLAHREIEQVCARAGVALAWQPILLGGLFRDIGAGGGPMETMSAAKARLNEVDLARWSELRGAPLRKPAAHPRRTVLAQRAILASGDVARAAKALFAAYWSEGADVAEPDVVARALDGAGLDGAACVRGAEAQKDALRARTAQAASLGLFGVPSFVLRRGDHAPLSLWGGDRLPLLERALGSAVTSFAPPDGAPARGSLDFWFDYSSPFAYLAATQIEARSHGAPVRWQPFLLGGLFRSIGTANVPLHTMPAPKQRYQRADMERWAQHYGVPFSFPSRFPMSTVMALRMTLALPEAERARLALALFHAYWARDRDIADAAELTHIAGEAGFDGEALLRGAELKKDELRAQTDAVQALGACGAPTFVVHGDDGATLLFWGQDRLELCERALCGWRPTAG